MPVPNQFGSGVGAGHAHTGSVLKCSEAVHAVEFCPYQHAESLLAYGTETKITLMRMRSSDNEDILGDEVEHLLDIHHGNSRVDCLAWSPQTQVSPQMNFTLCSGGADFKIRVYSGTWTGADWKTAQEMLPGHSSYINEVAFSPTQGEFIASVGDDLNCKLWDIKTLEEKFVFRLNSPGMSVCWHEKEPFKLMVAEKSGIIRFYNLNNYTPVISFKCPFGPLLSADWALGNESSIGAVAGGRWVVWDVSNPGTTPQNGQAHSSAVEFRWAKVSPSTFATRARSETLKFYNTGYSHVPTVHSQPGVIGGMSWHGSKPLCVTGGDSCLHFWDVEV
eukprot:Nk52_evm16s2192 gene=Nk52_evmTU16s2192